VAHGTARSTLSKTSSLDLRNRLAATLPHTSILNAFLDEPPLLEDLAPTLPPAPLIVVPWLLGGGSHHREDLVSRLGAALQRATVLPALAELSAFDDAILELAASHLSPALRP
jgi:sirohydrochlorin ferrochelatase